MVSNWVEKRFSAHKPLNTISDALSGLHYFLASTKKKPPFSWKPFSAWRRYEVPSRAPPITADLVLGFAGKCLANLDLIMAALLLLGFHCCLRTGELFLISADDILVNSKTGIVHVKASKGRLRRNVKESVTIECPIVRQVVLQMIDIQREAGLSAVPLWTHSGQAFRRTAFYRLCREFDVVHLNLRGYSLTRGGATAHGENLIVRGRSPSSSVARKYLCYAVSQLAEAERNREDSKNAEAISSNPSTYLSTVI